MALLAALVVAALVTGTVAAMVVTQSSRSDGPVASNIRMKTKPGPRYRVCFFLTREDTLDVDLVDADGDLIRSFASDARLEGDQPHCYDWDGRDQAGVAVAPGGYRLRLTLADAERVATAGERLRVEESR